MFSLISFVGWVICRYSIRYLDGDPNQGRFLRQFSLTLACVSVLVWSSSLLMFGIAWFAVSLALHPMLLHCSQRAGAKRAAWLKFGISRTGEMMLAAAAFLLLREFGTTSFADLAGVAASAYGSTGAVLSVCSWLLVLAVVLKTAQFPFHAWLPQTLDTPTPVSALMHAGVVNAGGFLMIRAGHWFVWDSSPLILLTAIGTLTAVYGAIVMTTQPTIKHQLAYSTVAQMGFMLLQCGLGAFSAAMLHLIAHALYKAHAFLSSGSVINDRQATEVTAVVPEKQPAFQGSIIVAQLVLASILTIGSVTLLISLASSKAGALPLLLMWGAAISYYAGSSFSTGCLRVVTRSLLAVGVLAIAYSISLIAIQKMLPGGEQTPAPNFVSVFIVLTGFSLLLAWHAVQALSPTSPRTKSLYIHVLNGFYLEAYWRRWQATR